MLPTRGVRRRCLSTIPATLLSVGGRTSHGGIAPKVSAVWPSSECVVGDFLPLFCCVMATLALPYFPDRVVRHLHRSTSTEPSAHPPPRASLCAQSANESRAREHLGDRETECPGASEQEEDSGMPRRTAGWLMGQLR